MALTLINAYPSPFGRKVRIALIEKGLEHDVRYDVPWGAETCTPNYNPLEQLPILILDDGTTVYDSVYILEWLEATYPSPPLLPAAIDRRLEAKKRQMLGERLMEAAQSLAFELHRADPSASWVERQARKIDGGLNELDRMHANRVLAPESAIDLGDIAVGTTLLLFEFGVASGLIPPTHALLWRDRRPALTQAVATLEQRPSFRQTMPASMKVDLKATVT